MVILISTARGFDRCSVVGMLRLAPAFASLTILVACTALPQTEANQGSDAVSNEAASGASGTSGGSTGVSCASHTFGSHCFGYAKGAILPTGSQATLDQATASFYDAWKAKYLIQACGDGRYYVQTAIDASGGGQDDNSITVSEGHGYGMVITAMMAGHDPDARKLFDGLYRFFRDHPSVNSPDLMAWNQVKGCQDDPDGGNDSATDGDLDIAFGLLLASKLWTGGDIDYAAEAKKVIAAVKAHEESATTHLALLGDWASDPSDPQTFATRPSDMMLDHYRAYATATGDAEWKAAIDANYTLVTTMQSSFAPKSGLIPDFIIKTNTSPAPAPANFLEDVTDGQYAYNSCRVPWHLGTDWLVSGDSRAKTALAKITAFMKQVSGGKPAKIVDGYGLDGSKVGTDPELAFIAPLGVAAMTDASNQAWLDALWNYVLSVKIPSSAYFGNTIKLLTMITMSGNWWQP